MIKIENTEVMGWEAAIRGMRNPMNSWDRSDSWFMGATGDMYNINGDIINGNIFPFDNYVGASAIPFVEMGLNDHKLMRQLVAGGPVHAKFRRMITVYVDITAPLYWWKEFDTYKIGTVANSCSTMHKIHAKEFTGDDFSTEHLLSGLMGTDSNGIKVILPGPVEALNNTIVILNRCREKYLKTKDKRYWWQMIQLLPSSYNQKRTVMLNYEVLSNIYKWRKDHKLDEWRELCEWIRTLPYSDIITGEEEK